MILVDYIAIGIIVLTLLCGVFAGFGKGLIFVTKGVVGMIISAVITWFLFGVVLSWGFVQDIIANFIASLESNGSAFCNFLITIRIDMILLGIVLFVIIQIIRLVILKFVKEVFESDNVAMKVLNKVLGVILFAAFFSVIILIAMQIAYMISGPTGGVFNFFKGSAFKLDELYLNNPLNSFIKLITG